MINERRTKRPSGRPRKDPGEGPRVQQALRVRVRIDDMVRQAADKNFRSISEELESRVNSTFDCIIVGQNKMDLIERIKASAEINNRSAEAETDIRLEKSFLIDELLASPHTYSLLISVAADILELEKTIGKPWRDEDVIIDTENYDKMINIFTYRLDREKKRYEWMRKLEKARKEEHEILASFNPDD